MHQDISSFSINTEHEDLNTLVNYWLKKQMLYLVRDVYIHEGIKLPIFRILLLPSLYLQNSHWNQYSSLKMKEYSIHPSLLYYIFSYHLIF